jgi:hypothetical protein
LNGAVLVRGHDYTATTGTTITGLSPALVASDVLEVFSFIAFTVANTYTQSQVDGFISTANAQPGMKLIVPTSAVNGTVSATGAVTFSGASSVSINDVFSATYTHYRVIANAVNSGDSGANFRFRVAGSDATSGDYFVQKNYISNSVNPTKTGATSATTIDLGPLWTGYNSYAYDIFNPFVTTRSQIIGNSFSLNSFSSWEGLTTFALLNTATSYTGFTFYPASGTMTGSIRVYGYKD